MTLDLDRFCRTLAQEAADAVIYADAGTGLIAFWTKGPSEFRLFGGRRLWVRRSTSSSPKIFGSATGWLQCDYAGTGKTRYGTGRSPRRSSAAQRWDAYLIEFTILPFHDGAGRVLGIAAILRDVTKRFEEMKTLRKELAAQKA